MTIQAWLTDWLTLRKPELKPRTYESYEDLFTRYVYPAFGSLDVADLTGDTVRHLLASVMAAGKSRTAEYLYTVMKCAFNDLDVNPMAKVKRPKHVQKSPEPWNEEQRLTYLAACVAHPHGLALSLALLLGLRRGEICGLRWKDIDFDQSVIHICNQRVRLATGEIIDCSPKSRTSDRYIPLPPQILARLRIFRGHPEAYLCSLTPSALGAAHRQLVARLDLPPIPLHGLRHTMATSCIRNGGEMRALQDILGHASYSTTANRYTHPDSSMLKATIDATNKPCYTVLHP